MIKVAGYWDKWFHHKENEYEVCWRFMLRHFGVDQISMIPNIGAREKLPLDYTDTELIEMDSIYDVLNANTNLVPVILDERGTTPLREFKHPENVLYIFGSTGRNPLDELQSWNGWSVNIEGNSQYVKDALLHPHQACSILLYDRMVKLWQ